MNDYQPLLLSHSEAEEIKHFIDQADAKNLFFRSYQQLRSQVDAYIAQPLEIPGQGEAGGYEHNRHKKNVFHLHAAAKLWLLTKDAQYLNFSRELLLSYAEQYTKLPLNTSKDSNPPGRLFHQTLNENMWLFYASDAYSCIHDELNSEEKTQVEVGLFRPMIELFVEDNHEDFDIIHNHGLWSVAAVGLCGYALNDQKVVDKALYGLDGSGETGGFLAQLSQLFSPDGYYMEGPYYHRFAIRPLLLFAEAISRRQPDIDIFAFNNNVIERTCAALIATLFPNGTFPALNDASKTMGADDEGVLVATALCYQHFGNNQELLALAKTQEVVSLNYAGLQLAKAIENQDIPSTFASNSLVIRDGANGDKGGLGILRLKQAKNVNMATLWYGQHGSDHTLHSALDHGHFDGLSVCFFNRNQEVLNDYGFGRWVNIEPKFGGRYIKENNTYCKQTIAHNTVVVDQTSQHHGDTALAEQNFGRLHFFSDEKQTKLSIDAKQAISAKIDEYNPGVSMQRTLIQICLPNLEEPILVDLARMTSHTEHTYDYPIHYNGQIIRTNFDYESHAQLSPLGEAFGYQHLWRVASAKLSPEACPSALVSWLMGDSYYSLLTSVSKPCEIIFSRIGANDPNFNLRNEPALIVRTKNSDHLFASVLETHGTFNEAQEISENARGQVKTVEVIGHNEVGSAIRIGFKDREFITVLVNNTDNTEGNTELTFEGTTYCWSGPYDIQ